MKVKILQGGGFATFTPIISSVPQPPQTTNVAQSSAGTSKESSSILDDETFKTLITKGLKNDVNRFVNDLIKLEQSSDTPFLDGSNRELSLRMIGAVNGIVRDKENFDEAIKTSQANGGYGEVAVGNTKYLGGEVYVKDEKNNIKPISIADYANRSKDYKVLTVSELMMERDNNPNLAGNSAVFDIANKSYGMSEILKEIGTLVSGLGKDTYSESRYYSKSDSEKEAMQLLQNSGASTPSEEQRKSLAVLKEAALGSGSYSKIDTSISTSNRQINSALNYLWTTLRPEKQQKIKAIAAINGEKDYKKFILDMMQSETGITSSISVEPKNESDVSGTGSGSGAGSAKQITPGPAEMFYSDKFYVPGTKYEFNDLTGSKMEMTATGVGALYNLDQSGSIIPPTVISNIMSGANYQAIVDPNKAFIGDTKIDRLKFQELAYSGDDVAKVYAPTNPDGSPDLSSLKLFKEVFNTFKANKDKWTTKQAETYFAKQGFEGVRVSEVQKPDGTIEKEIVDNQTVKPFLAIPVLTNSASDLSDIMGMVKLTGDDKDRADVIMDNAFTIHGGTAAKPTSKSIKPNYKLWFEDPYKGTLFVAFRPEANAVLSSMNNHLIETAPTATDVQRNLWKTQDINAGASRLQ